MRARVKKDYISNALRACGGTLFVKDQWTEVQPEHEKSALVNADLEVEVDGKPVEVNYAELETTASKYLDSLDPQPTERKPVKKGRR